MISLRELKERKLVQWALAYLAGAWLLLQLLTTMHQNFSWPPVVIRGATVVLGVGFFAALVVAWYHGEKGRQRVGTVELGMLTGILVLAGVGVAWVGVAPGDAGAPSTPVTTSESKEDGDALAPPAEQGSIAVLPFVDMSPEGDNTYFSDGITEELLNVLAQLPELRVTARTSAFAFKGTNVGIDSIARALNVRHVLEGSVRKADQDVRITAQLIDAATGYHLWSQTYDREVGDIFAVQDEIARAIVDQLQIELAGREGPLARAETVDPEAHALVLRARQMVGPGDPRTTLPSAERLFERAIALDSSYAAAWAGVANLHRVQVQFGLIPRESGVEQARVEAERALELNPDEGDAYLVLGSIALISGASSAAGEHFERALRVNPGDPRTLSFYSDWLAGQGRTDEALRATLRAVKIDPLSVPALSAAARLYRRSLDLETSAELYQRAMDLSPENPFVLSEFGFTQVLRGEREEALELAEQVLRLVSSSPWEVSRAGWIHAYAGEFERAVELLRRAVELQPENPGHLAALANVLVMVGEGEEAIDLAEQAVPRARNSVERGYLRVIQAYVYAKAGRPEAAERTLAEIPEHDYLGRAAVHTNLGHADQAFALLQRAVDEKDPGLAEIGADWWFDDLRGDPRMERLLKGIGVPDVADRR